MQLLYSATSPYSAKVRMAAHHAGLALEAIAVDTTADPAPLIAANPLGKIPTLLLSPEEIAAAGHGLAAIFDSRTILRYLDRISGGAIFPADPAERSAAEVLEALADGITDCLLAIVYERRGHPPEKVHEPYIDRQWQKASRGLDRLEADPPRLDGQLTGGHFALAALLGYLMLRFPGAWESGRPALSAWPAQFAARFDAYDTLKPQA